MINPTIGTVAKTVGLGVKKTRKPRAKKGKGFLTGMAKSGAKALAPMLIDVAATAVKDKVAGMGIKKEKLDVLKNQKQEQHLCQQVWD